MENTRAEEKISSTKKISENKERLKNSATLPTRKDYRKVY